MKNIILLLPFLSFLSCSPSIYQLKQYERAENLRPDTLYIVVYQADEESRLLDKYNQKRRLKKIKNKIEGHNQALLSAFEKNYTFSHTAVWYMEENDDYLPDAYYTDFQIYYDNSGENGEETKIAFNIKAPDHTTVATVIHDYSGRHSEYRYLVREMDKKLRRMYKKGLKLQNG